MGKMKTYGGNGGSAGICTDSNFTAERRDTCKFKKSPLVSILQKSQNSSHEDEAYPCEGRIIEIDWAET